MLCRIFKTPALTEDVDLNDTVDLTDVTLENGLTAFVNIYNYVADDMKSSNSITKDSLVTAIEDSLSISENA